MEKELVKYLEQFISERRNKLFNRVLENRTRYITVVLEDIYQSQNASAVLRTCDCFGIQDVHVIENRNRYNINPDVTLGSDKWLTMHSYSAGENSIVRAYSRLRKEGYRIVATTPHKKSSTVDTFDIGKGKAAFVFGTELTGLTGYAVENADQHITIPMHGFTESFNISVSAALVLQKMTGKLKESGIDSHLSPAEKCKIKLEWLKRSIRKSDLLVAKFLGERG